MNYIIYTTSTSIGTGLVNSIEIVDAIGLNNDIPYPAQVCLDFELTYQGETFSDWYLPSKDEVHEMYRVLKLFGLGNLAGKSLWTSSEDPEGNLPYGQAWAENMENGYQYSTLKHTRLEKKTRAGRSF